MARDYRQTACDLNGYALADSAAARDTADHVESKEQPRDTLRAFEVDPTVADVGIRDRRQVDQQIGHVVIERDVFIDDVELPGSPTIVAGDLPRSAAIRWGE